MSVRSSKTKPRRRETSRSAKAGGGSPRHLVAIGDGVLARLPLPASGAVTIGRGSDVDVQLDAPSLSRRHATLRLDRDGMLTIEDLGSLNGTTVHAAALPPHVVTPFKIGDVIELGSVLVSVQYHVAQQRPRRVWTHPFFEAHLEHECTRASYSGGAASFAVFAITGDDDIEEVLGRVLRPMDIVGIYAPDQYEAIIVGALGNDADQVARQIISAHGPGVRVGIALYPRDGRDTDALIAAARARLEGAAPPTRPSLPAAGAMQELRRLVESVAPGTISVLVLGETGVGKEVLAESIHRASKRANKPYLKLNCAALSESLLESELFGHERGAFTGAVGSKPGLLETADGGTVFIDEIGELAMSIQVKLLRVLEERAVMRVGSVKTIEIDVRFVAATNRDLEAEIAKGTFRQDLYFRLNGITLVIPPLRDRVDEIAGLARAFLRTEWRKLERGDEPEPQLSPSALALLESYAWPGNIRELRNIMERAALLCRDGVITDAHLPADRIRAQLAPAPASRAVPVAAPAAEVPRPAPSLPPTPRTERPAVGPLAESVKREVESVEKQQILDALAQCAGNQTQAARLLKISRATMVSRLNEYGIVRPRKGRE